MGTYNLLILPDDLRRLTVPEDLLYCIASLSRLLRATRPYFQEWDWAMKATVAAAPDWWFELRMGGEVTGYMKIGERHGRYSHARPQGVPDDQIRVIEQTLPPPTTLRDFLALLGEKIAVEDPVESVYTLARAKALRADNTSAYGKLEYEF